MVIAAEVAIERQSRWGHVGAWVRLVVEEEGTLDEESE